MSRCELCGTSLPQDIHECESCTGLEMRTKIKAILEETLQFLANRKSTGQEQHDVYFLMGNFHRLAGDYDKAVEYYEKAIGQMGAKPHYHHMLATALAARGDYSGSVEAMKKAVAISSTYPDYRNDLGAAYFKDGRFDEAIAEFKEAVRLNPGYANAHNNLAFCYRKKKMHAEAEREIREAIQLDPIHAIGGYELGTSYYSGGMFSQLKSGAAPLTAKTLGDIYAMREMHADAVEQYEKYVEMHPTYPDVHYSLGRSQAALGLKAKARESFENALKINPNYKQAKEALEKL
jgi:Flp pilus assembly protein TadD